MPVMCVKSDPSDEEVETTMCEKQFNSSTTNNNQFIRDFWEQITELQT